MFYSISYELSELPMSAPTLLGNLAFVLLCYLLHILLLYDTHGKIIQDLVES